MGKKNVLLATTSDFVIAATSYLVENSKNHRIVCSTREFEKVPDLIQQHNPDILVLDASHDVASLNGVVPTSIRDDHRNMKLVVLCDQPSDKAFLEAYELGADALLARTQSRNAIYATIDQLDGNKAFFTQSEVAQVRARYSNSLESKLNTLDHSDREILRLLAQGKSDKEIAATVYMANQTVRNRISRLFKSFDKRNRTELAVFLQQSGLYSFEGAA